jgi:hypothetical protein
LPPLKALIGLEMLEFTLHVIKLTDTCKISTNESRTEGPISGYLGEVQGCGLFKPQILCWPLMSKPKLSLNLFFHYR